jgi:hypothetical protein
MWVLIYCYEVTEFLLFPSPHLNHSPTSDFHFILIVLLYIETVFFSFPTLIRMCDVDVRVISFSLQVDDKLIISICVSYQED